ncbi:putative amino acid permease YhdG [Anaerohalosphaera lusitana]|uniref:Putative amino acid permease YhdG n=1 Tax=Anaerohalosphaera lusitana TaxID=1936003 RepID=A0A1U9NJ57_9BACT|nr:amino acid permease [Anaerohalosphaera lusitana]AQT67972.1 putative amino acid permease YhdG [Anaerohalosphaera lusitana]
MLKKELGLMHVFCIASGAMISSGLFVLPGIAFEKAGPAVVFSYAFAGILVIPVILAQSELATAMPRSGASYFFVERSLGPLAGTIAGLCVWMAIALKAAFAMIGIGALASFYTGNESQALVKIVAVAACLFFMGFNLLSAKGSGSIQVFLVFGLLLILTAYCFRSVPRMDGSSYMPFAPQGWNAVLAVTGMVFVSYGGLTGAVDIAEEVQQGGRNLPLGMFLAFAIVNIFYVVVVFVTVGVTKPDQLAGSLAPIGLGGEAVFGRIGRDIINIAAFLAFATTANAGVLSSSRTPMAMSRDGLLPGLLARTSRRFKTPYIAILLTGSLMITLIVVFSVEDLIKTASTILILTFVLTNASVVIMRFSGMQAYRPKFKIPLNPYLPIVCIIIYIFLIVEMGIVPLITAGVFAVAATLWYVFYVQKRIDRQSAIVYLVKNIVSRHIGRSGLEEELQHIALERDEITPDRFDRLVRKCPIIDIKSKITAKQLFHTASTEMAKRLDVDEKHLYRLFLERERESATVVRPGLAIPHIVVEGDGVFDVLLVRCKKGIVFSELHEPVRTAFVLVGSPDERNYHLRALMIIAHIVSEPDFEQRWFAAKNIEQLRDIVLLSGRQREHKK